MRARTLTAAAALLLGAITLPTTPAIATGGGHGTTPCKPITHTTTSGWTGNGATAVLHASKGIVLTTGDDNAHKTTFTRNIGPVKLGDVKKLAYQTEKEPGDNNPVALPGYFLRVDVNDDGTTDTTLMYEPYYQVSGNPTGSTTTWDVDAGKWWSNSPTTAPFMSSWADNEKAGGSYAGNKTLTEIRGFWPEAKVTGFGINLGTYNKNVVVRVNDVTFSGGRVCETHGWKPAPVKPAGPEIIVTPGTCTMLGTLVVVKVPQNGHPVLVAHGDIRKTIPAGGTYEVTILKGDLTVWGPAKKLIRKIVHTAPTACPTATTTATASPTATATSSPSATASVTVSPSASVTPTASPSVTRSSVVVVPAGGDQLPKTGGQPLLFVAVGVLVLVVGAVTVLMVRRPKRRFQA